MFSGFSSADGRSNRRGGMNGFDDEEEEEKDSEVQQLEKQFAQWMNINQHSSSHHVINHMGSHVIFIISVILIFIR